MWPEGSVWSVRNTRPEVFCQKLVQLPPVLSQMTSLSSQELLQQLQSLVPQLSLIKLMTVFWLKTAVVRFPSRSLVACYCQRRTWWCFPVGFSSAKC